MNFIDALIAVLATAVVLSSIILAVINKKKGKSSCGCDCQNCSQCSSCKIKSKKEQVEK